MLPPLPFHASASAQPAIFVPPSIFPVPLPCATACVSTLMDRTPGRPLFLLPCLSCQCPSSGPSGALFLPLPVPSPPPCVEGPCMRPALCHTLSLVRFHSCRALAMKALPPWRGHSSRLPAGAVGAGCSVQRVVSHRQSLTPGGDERRCQRMLVAQPCKMTPACYPQAPRCPLPKLSLSPWACHSRRSAAACLAGCAAAHACKRHGCPAGHGRRAASLLCTAGWVCWSS